MGKNTNTYKSKKIKSKTMKSGSSKIINKNKKLLKKMMNSESELDDINSLIDNSISDNSALEENIQILIGGDNNFVEPSELDKKLFGYKGLVDTQGPVDKFIDSVEGSIDNVKEVAENVVSVGKVAVLNKMSNIAGYEGKTPKEVMDEIKNDAESIKKINNYFKTEDGDKTLKDIQDLSNTATGIITKSFEKIPEKLTDTIEKIGDAGLKVGVGVATEVPIIAPIIGMSNMIKGTEEAIEATADAVKKVAEITEDTAEEIKKPINEIENKIDEISTKIENTQIPTVQHQIDESQIDKSQMDKSQMDKSQMDESQMDKSQIDKSQIDEYQMKTNEKNVQYGGSDMNNFYNLLQNGGKKLRKRINNTRHAFKNISRNITKKNK
jgi:hypothetical protein